ncbi:MAG: phage portal protein [Sphingomonas sanxanigenens]|uniref:Phage portal protein n=1 Tax=Sphingomonas sanxanigenens TaxID=397260 RepID=A0A2W5C8Q4_9SPHN|nr:MAG: phage portal protein [Sphingomonas sanxanigenens]
MSDQLPIASAGAGITAFTFGDPESVLDRRQILDCIEVWNNGRWYEPPVSFHDLVRSFDVAAHHSSCIRLKRNMLVKHFVPSRWLDRETFSKWALDYLVLGNGFVERRDNLAGKPLVMKHALGRYTRRGVVDGHFFFVPAWRQEYEFPADRVFHVSEEHPGQEIYGVPEYLSAMQSAFLNEAATLFRRRYFLNGSHAGFVFYLNEKTVSNADADAIRQALKESKGVGNFKNLFLHAPDGKKDGVQIIPISEVAAKDEFAGIKNVSRDDMLASHRVPPQLLGVVPTNSGGFGDVSKAADVFYENEIEPLQGRFMGLNDWLGVEAVAFAPYERQSASPAAPATGARAA